MRSSKGNLESRGFKNNILCVNVGYIDEGQLSNVVTEEEKSKILAFQEMKGDSQNLMMKEEEQLLNFVVKYFASNGQSLKADAKEENKLKGNIEYFVEDGQSLWIVNLEDSQDKESWLIVDVEEEDNEDCIEYMGEIPKEMVSLYHKLNLLEQRLEKQQVDIQVAKLELDADEEVVIYDKSEKEVVRDIKFLRKQSETFLLEDLNNYGKNLCADTRKHEVSSKKDIISKY
jgi:hypothetical protein